MKHNSKSTFIAILSTLMFIETIILVKIFFIDQEDFEWGSVSDWFSAVSSIITTIIAYLAYKAAPNWLKQKQNETGFNHVCSLMTEYDEIQLNLQKLYFDITSINYQKFRNEEINNQLIEYIYRIIALREKLGSCRRWKIGVPVKVYDAFALLQDFCSTSLTILHCSNLGDKEKFYKEQDKLTNTKNHIIRDAKSFQCDIESIFLFK